MYKSSHHLILEKPNGGIIGVRQGRVYDVAIALTLGHQPCDLGWRP